LLKQCDQELAQLNHRKTIATASVRQMEEKLELYGRRQISEAYHTANEAEMRAFMMGEEREQLATTIGVYERYRQYLKRAINVLGSAPQSPASPQTPPQRQPRQPHAPTLAQRPQSAENYPAPVALQWRPPTSPDAGPLWPAPPPQQPALPEVPPMGLTSRFQGPEQALGVVTSYFPPEAYAEHAPPDSQGSQATGQATPSAGAQAGRQQRDQLAAMAVARIIQSQEELRLRIAQQLHDGPTQSLSNLVLTAEFCERTVQSDPRRALGELGHLKRLVNEALQQTRAFIFELRPMTLDDLGLTPTLRRYAAEQMARYEREHEVGEPPLEIDVQTPRGESRLPPTIETALFRVAQEAIGNAITHGAAKHILVTILVAPDHVKLIVDDDGRGFDVDEALAWAMIRHSTGLASMQERAEMLSGWLIPWSERGKGSRIEISAPLPPRTETGG
jgi:signal transduction histidine kinase